MAAHYFADPKDKAGVYRDTDVHLESDVAGRSATQAFEAELNAPHTKKVKPDAWGNWDSKKAILVGAYLMMDAWLKAPALSEAEKKALRTDSAVRERHADSIMRDVERRLPERASGAELRKLRKLAEELTTNPELRGKANFTPKVFTTEVKILDNTSSANGAKRKMEINRQPGAGVDRHPQSVRGPD